MASDAKHPAADCGEPVAPPNDGGQRRGWRRFAPSRERRLLLLALSPLLAVLFWLATWEQRPIWNFCFSPDGAFLAATGPRRGRDAAQIWDVTNGRVAWSIDSPGESEAAAFSPDGKTLAVGFVDGTMEFWDVATRAKRFQFSPHQGFNWSLGFSADGKELVSIATPMASIAAGRVVISPADIVISDADDGKELAAIRAPAPHSTALSRDGRRAAVSVFGQPGQKDGVTVYDLSPGRRGAAHFLPCTAHGLAFCRDGTRLAIAAQNTVRIWDVEAEQFVGTFVAKSPIELLNVVFSPDGNLLAASGMGGLALWDVSSGKRLWLTPAPKWAQFSFAIAFSPDGRTLAATIYESPDRYDPMQVQLYDIATGRELAVLAPNRPFALVLAGWMLAFSVWAIAWVRSGLNGPRLGRAFVDVFLVDGLVVVGLVARLANTGVSGNVARLPAAAGLGALTGLFSLVIVWAVLAPTRWQWRMPALVAGWAITWAILIAVCGALDFGQHSIWQASIGATVMIATLLGVLWPLRARGLRLAHTADVRAGHICEPERKRQFHLRDMLTWIFAAAVLFGVARFVAPQSQPLAALCFEATVGAGLALACAAGFWAVCGRSPLAVRLVALALAPLVCGSFAQLFRKSLVLHPWWWYVASDVAARLFVAGSLAVFSLHGLRLRR